jgi:hypothetical protein
MQRLRFRSGSDAPRYDYGSRVSAAVLRAARSASISANQAIAFSLESVRRPSKMMVTSSEVGGPPISAAAHSSPVIVGRAALTQPGYGDGLCSRESPTIIQLCRGPDTRVGRAGSSSKAADSHLLTPTATHVALTGAFLTDKDTSDQAKFWGFPLRPSDLGLQWK